MALREIVYACQENYDNFMKFMKYYEFYAKIPKTCIFMPHLQFLRF